MSLTQKILIAVLTPLTVGVMTVSAYTVRQAIRVESIFSTLTRIDSTTDNIQKTILDLYRHLLDQK